MMYHPCHRNELATKGNQMFDPAMKTFFDAEGYLVVENVFSDAELADVRRRTDEIIANPASAPEGVSVGRESDTVVDKTDAAANNQSVRNIGFLARFDPIFRSFARQPKLLELVRGLIGPRVKVFRDQMLLKPPGGQAKPPHQDQSYFRVQPEDALITAWIALDEATIANGCMQYIPGSHRHGIFPIAMDPERPTHHVPDTGTVELVPAAVCPVSVGSIIFHGGCTLHNSAENSTDTWRRALILHYATTESRSENEKLNQEVSLEID
jgi:ectoine hydroxylase-related dioxygenase (phytanoyl-CoA dioxygenase family)